MILESSRTSRRRDSLNARSMVLPLVAPMASLIPVYLIGAMVAQLDASIGLDVSRLSIATAAYFVAAAALVHPMGAVANALGSVRTLQVALVASGATMILTGWLATSWVHIVVCMVLCGGLQGMADPSSGAYLTRAIPEAHRGVAFGLKLAAIPVAAMLCGLSVPLVAEPYSWRWVLIGDGALVILALLARPLYRPSEKSEPRRPPKLRHSVGIGKLTVGIALGFMVANVFTTFAVSSAVDSGLSPSVGGILFACGGCAGALGRIVVGIRAAADPVANLRTVTKLVLAAGVACLALVTGSPVAHALVIPVAFIAVWVWAPLYQLAVTSVYSGNPAGALRRINVAVYVGSVVGPLTFGALTNRGYGVAWALGFGASALAALAISAAGKEIRTTSATARISQ